MGEAKLTFSEFCNRAKISTLCRAGFEAHCRLYANFNHRTYTEWERLLSEYSTADRSRRRVA